jgi:hypothetical protein
MKDKIVLYEIKKVPINSIYKNPSNPRCISESKFQKLVQSIKDVPWMLKLRPIVVNDCNIILGGNQRHRACVEAGMTHVWIIKADKITDAQQRRFILRDNIDFGKYDQEILWKHYTPEEFVKYGGEIELLEKKAVSVDEEVKPPPPIGDDVVEPNLDEEGYEESSEEFKNKSVKQVVFFFQTDQYVNVIKDLDDISKKLDCDDNSEVLLHLVQFYEYSNGLTKEA